MGNNKKQLIGAFLILSLVCGLGLGCLTNTDREMESINITYPVRDVHIGYVNGASIIVVEYLDGNTIKLIDNKMSTMCDPHRIHEITIKPYEQKESYLLHYGRLAHPKPYVYPKGWYILYLNDNLSLKGIGSNNPHPDRADEETFLG